MKKMLLALLIVPALAWGQTYRPLGIRTTTGALDGYTPGYVSNWTNVLGDAPHNTSVYARSNGTWVVLSPSSTNASAWVTANSNAVQYMIGQTGYWDSAWAWVNSNSGGVSYVFGQTGTWDFVSSYVLGNTGNLAYVFGQVAYWDQAITNVFLSPSNSWGSTKVFGDYVVIDYPTNLVTAVDVTNIVNVMTQGLAQASSIPSTNGFTTFPDVTNIVNVMTQGLAQASSIPSTNGFTTFPDVTNVVNVMTQGLAQASSVPSTNGLEQASHATATFVPYTGATAAVNLGGQSATNVGTIHGTNIVAMGTLNVSNAILQGVVAQFSGTNGSAFFLSTKAGTISGSCSFLGHNLYVNPAGTGVQANTNLGSVAFFFNNRNGVSALSLSALTPTNSSSLTPLFVDCLTGNIGISKAPPAYLLDMEASGGGYYSASDHQWHNGSSGSIKTNVVTMANQIETLMGMRPVTYNCLSNAIVTTTNGEGVVTVETNRVTGKATAGFIAEELALVLPNAVDMNTNGVADGVTLQPIVAAIVDSMQRQFSVRRTPQWTNLITDISITASNLDLYLDRKTNLNAKIALVTDAKTKAAMLAQRDLSQNQQDTIKSLHQAVKDIKSILGKYLNVEP
jgi:hypothetical protein